MTERPDNVRFARKGDEDALMAMMVSMHEENGQAGMSESKVRAMIDTATQGERFGARVHCAIGVAESDDGTLGGSIGLGLAQWWYSDAWHIEELWNYVSPDYRKISGRSHARELLAFGKWFAESMHIPFLVGVMSQVRTEAKVRFYTRQNLPQVGALFLYQGAGA